MFNFVVVHFEVTLHFIGTPNFVVSLLNTLHGGTSLHGDTLVVMTIFNEITILFCIIHVEGNRKNTSLLVMGRGH